MGEIIEHISLYGLPKRERIFLDYYLPDGDHSRSRNPKRKPPVDAWKDLSERRKYIIGMCMRPDPSVIDARDTYKWHLTDLYPDRTFTGRVSHKDTKEVYKEIYTGSCRIKRIKCRDPPKTFCVYLKVPDVTSAQQYVNTDKPYKVKFNSPEELDLVLSGNQSRPENILRLRFDEKHIKKLRLSAGSHIEFNIGQQDI